MGREQRSWTWFARFWLPVLAYVGIIFALSAQPNLQPPFRFQNSDKFAHLAEYFGLGVLLVRALRATDSLSDAVRGGLVALLIGMSIGASDELFQSTVPGRESSVRDFAADCGGLVVAQLAYLLIRRE